MQLRQVQKLSAVFRHQVLVGGHHMFARFQRLPDIGTGRFYASHQFDHNIDLRIVHNTLPVVGQNLLRNSFSLFRQIFYQYLFDVQIRLMNPQRKFLFSSLHQFVDASAYRSQPQKSRSDPHSTLLFQTHLSS